MNFRAMMKRAVAKCKPCRTCGAWPCACPEIARRIQEQLRLKLPAEARWRDARRQERREERR